MIDNLREHNLEATRKKELRSKICWRQVRRRHLQHAQVRPVKIRSHMREQAMRIKIMSDFMHEDIKRCCHVFQKPTREHAVQACERKKNHRDASSMLYYHKLSSKSVNNDVLIVRKKITTYSEQIVFRSHYVQNHRERFQIGEGLPYQLGKMWCARVHFLSRVTRRRETR